MRSFWGFILFLSIFLSLYGGMNAYVLFRLAALLALKNKIYIFILWVFLTSSFILASVLEAKLGNSLTHFIYSAAALWMGMLILLFSIWVS